MRVERNRGGRNGDVGSRDWLAETAAEMFSGVSVDQGDVCHLSWDGVTCGSRVLYSERRYGSNIVCVVARLSHERARS
jgi:hypothetical protein